MRKSEQLQVKAFKKADRSDTPEDDAVFKFIINPESLVSCHKNQFSPKRGINTSGRSAPYAFSLSEEITIELMLDNTLSDEFLPSASLAKEETIKETVDRYLKYCFYMDGDIHEPRFLITSWGKGLEFECRLKSVQISYSCFNDEGLAMRAKLVSVFVEDMSTEKRIRLENKNSSDISHSRLVLQGQTLTALTKEVYGNASHYLFVAQANELDHFRSLEPGTTLYFPPLGAVKK